MKQILLATVAAVALSFPAMAHTNKVQEPAKTVQMQLINPMQLTRQQVRQVQRALDKMGFNARKVDGIWGPETAAALRNFQQSNGIDAHGHLTRQTLAKLGVNWASSKQQPSTVGYGDNKDQNMSKPNHKVSETTGSGSSQSTSKPNKASQTTGSGTNQSMSKPSHKTSETTGSGSSQNGTKLAKQPPTTDSGSQSGGISQK